MISAPSPWKGKAPRHEVPSPWMPLGVSCRDFSDLTARGSEVEVGWGAEGAEVVSLPRSTLCQEATGSREVAKCV